MRGRPAEDRRLHAQHHTVPMRRLQAPVLVRPGDKMSPGPAARQTLEGSFSAVSKPNFASKYAFESSRRDLHNALLCTAPKSHFFQKISRICQNLRKFSEILRNSQFFKPIFCEKFEIAAVQKYANLVELEKCCQTHILLQNFVLMQPRTSQPKNCKI